MCAGQKNDAGPQKQGVSAGGLVDCSALERELGTSLGPVLDALSLGLNDKEVADLAELTEAQVRDLRARLGGVGSQMGISFKKPVCQHKEGGSG